MRPRPDAPVVALDIDGTLGAYHEHFTRFAEAWTGKPMPSASEPTGAIPFHKHLGISKSTYRKVKLAYRQGGLKRSMPVYPYAGALTRYIRERGVQVWITTTRPYLSLDNIEPDTKHWLIKRAHAQYDNCLFGEHKYRDLVKAVGKERVVMVIDDLPEMIDQACGLGLRAYIRTQPYNVEYTRLDLAGRVNDLMDAMGAFDKEWRTWARQ
jgi:phosphoglycolate phosphatase-like HAD superfamily hydrolase